MDVGKVFIFSQIKQKEHKPDECVVHIPKGILEKQDLFGFFDIALRFPYFGKNWDALYDCLRDLSWLGVKKVVLIHKDLPLQEDPAGLKIYLETLCDCVEEWQSRQLDFEFKVHFPGDLLEKVQDMLKDYVA